MMRALLHRLLGQRTGTIEAPPSASPQAPNPDWIAEREAEARSAETSVPPDWTRAHCARGAKLIDLHGRSVLVVGCNRGDGECRYFMETGAAAVTGVDIMPEIGTLFAHPSVTYVRTTAERMPLRSDAFDFVFSVATLEHIPDIGATFREMARVAAPGGYIFSVAAPLWYWREGPHWGDAFNADPWPHLRLTVDEIVALGQHYIREGSTSPYHSEAHLRTHLEAPWGMANYNRRRPHEYVDACASLDQVDILRNDIEMDPQRDTRPDLVRELKAKGYTDLDLFGMTHTLVARKR